MTATMGKIESRKRDRQRATECGYGVIKTSWKLIKALTKNCNGEGEKREREGEERGEGSAAKRLTADLAQ